jgi:hypothetical protein
MPSISKDDKTITWVCPADDEGQVRVGLKELLDANPGYTPVLIVEDAAGKETTHTSLDAPKRRRSAPTVVSDIEAGDPDYYEEEDNQN